MAFIMVIQILGITRIRQYPMNFDVYSVLVGYSYFIFVTLSHYKQITIAVNDTLYVDPDYRKGMVGYKFIKFAETQLVSLNVQEIMWRTKLGEKNFGTLLERLGYFPEEVSYTKMVNIKE